MADIYALIVTLEKRADHARTTCWCELELREAAQALRLLKDVYEAAFFWEQSYAAGDSYQLGRSIVQLRNALAAVQEKGDE